MTKSIAGLIGICLIVILRPISSVDQEEIKIDVG